MRDYCTLLLIIYFQKILLELKHHDVEQTISLDLRDCRHSMILQCGYEWNDKFQKSNHSSLNCLELWSFPTIILTHLKVCRLYLQLWSTQVLKYASLTKTCPKAGPGPHLCRWTSWRYASFWPRCPPERKPASVPVTALVSTYARSRIFIHQCSLSTIHFHAYIIIICAWQSLKPPFVSLWIISSVHFPSVSLATDGLCSGLKQSP